MTDKPIKTGYIKFNLDEYDGGREMRDALNAGRYKMKIDELYNDVFRPFFKYGHSFMGEKIGEAYRFSHTLEDRQVVEDVNEWLAEAIEDRIVQAIWNKVQKHFEMEE